MHIMWIFGNWNEKRYQTTPITQSHDSLTRKHIYTGKWQSYTLPKHWLLSLCPDRIVNQLPVFLLQKCVHQLLLLGLLWVRCPVYQPAVKQDNERYKNICCSAYSIFGHKREFSINEICQNTLKGHPVEATESLAATLQSRWNHSI